MRERIDPDRPPTEPVPLDWTASRYFIQFGSGLLSYLTVSLTILLLLPDPGNWMVPAAVATVGLAIAVFIRIWRGWPGFLTGAIAALLFAAMLQAVLYWFLRIFLHPAGVLPAVLEIL